MGRSWKNTEGGGIPKWQKNGDQELKMTVAIRGSREIPSSSTLWGGHSKKAPLWTRKRALTSPWICRRLDLGPPSLQSCEQYLFVVYKRLSLCYIFCYSNPDFWGLDWRSGKCGYGVASDKVFTVVQRDTIVAWTNDDGDGNKWTNSTNVLKVERSLLGHKVPFTGRWNSQAWQLGFRREQLGGQSHHLLIKGTTTWE